MNRITVKFKTVLCKYARLYLHINNNSNKFHLLSSHLLNNYLKNLLLVESDTVFHKIQKHEFVCQNLAVKFFAPCMQDAVCVITKNTHIKVCERSIYKNSMLVGSQGYICAKFGLKIQQFILFKPILSKHLLQKHCTRKISKNG